MKLAMPVLKDLKSLPLKIILLICLSVFLPHFASARDVFVMITDADDASLDASRWLVEAKMIEKSINTLSPWLDVRLVRVRRLSELESQIQGIDSGDQVNGVMFIGHGNKSVFGFSSRDVYSGPQVAKILYKALAGFQLTPNFTVYFNACATGQCDYREKNLQDAFGEAFVALLEQRNGIPQLQIVSHVYDAFSSSSKPSGLASFTPFQKFLFRIRFISFVEKAHAFSKRLPFMAQLVIRLWPTLLAIAGRHLLPDLVTPDWGAVGLGLSALNLVSFYSSAKIARLIEIRDRRIHKEIIEDVYPLMQRSLCARLLVNREQQL